jgi:hypothetical protein
MKTVSRTLLEARSMDDLGNEMVLLAYLMKDGSVDYELHSKSHVLMSLSWLQTKNALPRVNSSMGVIGDIKKCLNEAMVHRTWTYKTPRK